jgi:hypothetical protein
VDVTYDTSHECHNDAKAFLKEASEWRHCLQMLIAFNVWHGPWKGADRWWQAKQALEDYYQQLDFETDPLWQFFLPLILKDKNEEQRIAEPDISRKVFEEMIDSPLWNRQGRYVCMARFMGYTSKAAETFPHWHEIALVMCYLNISNGNFSRLGHASLVENKTKIKAIVCAVILKFVALQSVDTGWLCDSVSVSRCSSLVTRL